MKCTNWVREEPDAQEAQPTRQSGVKARPLSIPAKNNATIVFN
jgi:hypothetical protein